MPQTAIDNSARKPTTEAAITVPLAEYSALKRNESLLRDSIETSPLAMHWTSEDGTLVWANQAELDLLGFTQDEYIGRNFADFYEDRQVARDILARVGRGETDANYPASLRHRDGSLRHVLIGSNAVFEDGKFVHACAIARDVTALHIRQNATALLGAIVDSSEDAIVSKDLNGVITSWNKSAERVFGFTADEATGRTVAELLIPADRQEEEPIILARLHRGERVEHFETVRKRRDGTLRDISLTISPVRDASGTVVGASKIARDITEQKAGERKLARTQQIFLELVERAPFGIYIVDSQLRIAQMNFASQDGAFSSVRPVIGRDISEVMRVLWPEPVADKIVGLFRHTLDTGQPYHSSDFVETRRDRDTTESYEWQLHRMVLPDGEYGVICYYFDSTGIRNAEAALRASEERFRRLAEIGPHIIWLHGPAGELEFVNQRWVDYSGLDLEATKDPDRLAHHLHPDDRLLEHWRHAVATGTPFELEARLRARSGDFRWFIMRSVPVRDDRGRVVRWVGASTDIHENKTLQIELQRANGDLEQFAYSASHDLQEPLRTIRIYTELLSSRCSAELSGDAAQFLGFLTRAAARMESLVHDLLLYTQLSRIDATPDQTDAREVLSANLADLEGAIRESGASVTFGDLPTVRMHRLHLKQLLQNLVGNAIKYRAPERTPFVHVSAEKENNSWTFTIRDNGIGIQPEYKEQIFGLFRRLHNSDRYSGTGIGLAICQRIVERYQGRIWVDSEPGQGSSFRFTIPV